MNAGNDTKERICSAPSEGGYIPEINAVRAAAHTGAVDQARLLEKYDDALIARCSSRLEPRVGMMLVEIGIDRVIEQHAGGREGHRTARHGHLRCDERGRRCHVPFVVVQVAVIAVQQSEAARGVDQALVRCRIATTGLTVVLGTKVLLTRHRHLVD